MREAVSELKVVEICAGAGGQSLGLHLAGYRHELAVEIDASAAATLRRNLARLEPGREEDDRVRVGDVADPDVWEPSEFAGVDLFAGGVPCPPFSRAGKQLGSGDERDLFAWAVNATAAIQPKALLLENVRGLADSRFAAYRQAVVDRLDELGYTADWELLEARDFGVPQLRPRMVLVALQHEFAPYFEWPEPKPTEATVGTTLAGMMGANGFPYLDEWVERANTIAPTIVGGSKKHGGADLGPTRAKRAWSALWVDGHGLANEAPGPDWDRNLPQHQRGPKLTVDMVAKLQGWDGPEYHWEFEGKKTSKYRQVGNAFPPPVARAVGESIARAIRREGSPAQVSPTRRMHDEVYRVLRDSGDWMTLGRIQRSLGGVLSAEEVQRRIDLISRDFQVEVKQRGGHTSYALREWKAFQGQPDHHRHEAFAAARSRIS
jgi:DNA (cytosine-5)-methyltransferase 1